MDVVDEWIIIMILFMLFVIHRHKDRDRHRLVVLIDGSKSVLVVLLILRMIDR